MSGRARFVPAFLSLLVAFPVLAAQPPLVGKIEIPRLGVSAVVREGADGETLRVAVGHIAGTALPGASGNVGLAAHRNTFFKPLKDVKMDDVVVVTTPTGDHRYRVSSIEVVTPKDLWVLDPTNDPTLTLVTCYPFDWIGEAPQRLIVKAVADDGTDAPATRLAAR